MFKKTWFVLVVVFGLAGVASSVLAETVSKNNASAATVSCVAAAVNVRETAIGSAINTQTQAVRDAYSVRASALKDAYNQTGGNSAIAKAVKTAWSAYRIAIKDAGKAWKAAKNTAWSQFRKDIKVCKAPSAIHDSANSSFETIGQ